MSSASGRFVVTFNGEIYNFGDLRKELRSHGAAFQTRSDTEVLLAAVEQWGVVATLPRLRGMFAFAIWDIQERQLWLARDRLGIKPLYFWKGKEGIAFASEVRAFHCFPGFDRKIDPAASDSFLRRMYVPSPRSIFAGVEKLAPGQYVRFATGVSGPVEEHRCAYWDLREVAYGAKTPAKPMEAVDRFEELLRESIRLRLVADVPVGAFLSGGVDSTVVTSIMQDLASEAVRTFTIEFDDDQFNEGPAAAEIARHLGTRHTAVRFSSDEVLRLIPTLPGLSDEPMANPSLLPTLLVSRVARREVVVALSGDGGDELFGGYNRYLHGARLITRAQHFPRVARQALSRICAQGWTAGMADAVFRLGRPTNVGHQQTSRERLRKVAAVLSASNYQEAYHGLLDVGWKSHRLSRDYERAADGVLASESLDIRERMMLHDQLDYLPDDLLAKLDRASMWASLEARVPLLDHHVVEFSWAMQIEHKIRGSDTKWLLRQIASRYVPESILRQPKMGFTVPIADWLRTDLREWARDLLSPDRLRSMAVVDPRKVHRAWVAFEAGGRNDLALPLWTVAVLSAWCDAWQVQFS